MGDTANSISPETLSSRIGTHEAPLVFDVRRAEIYAEAPDVIPSAVWRDPRNCGTWGRDLPKDREIAVYCVHGHEVSQGAAKALAALGHSVRYLAGGIEGYRAAGGRVTAKPKPGGC